MQLIALTPIRTGRRRRLAGPSLQKSEAERQNKCAPDEKCQKSKAACGKEQIVSWSLGHWLLLAHFIHIIIHFEVVLFSV